MKKLITKADSNMLPIVGSSSHNSSKPIVSRRFFSEDEFMKEYYCEQPPHNNIACQAAKEYENYAQARDEYMYEQLDGPRGNKINGRRLNTPPLKIVSMSYYSEKYNVTIEEMKQHWKCVDNGG
jgi:hypothetical protein